MKRNPRKLKWTKAFRKAAGKEMVCDTTLQLAARRNVPVRYDRELVAKTVKAMDRIADIRARRERAFYKRRMAGRKDRDLAAARKLVAENQHLLPRMRGSEKRRLAEEAEALADETTGRLRAVASSGMVRRQVLTADGAVVEVGEAGAEGAAGDGNHGDDDGMDMD